ncbi:MAG: TfoX/Sxy family protein [Cycloclasticus sp.]|nr:TfoX/Sxy family protein [Cycloclasticus sp.]
MAKEYFEKLSQLISSLDIQAEVNATLETKHFFSGAALYANKTICASWSPGGLAFKLSESEVRKLLSSGKAVPLKYFEKGHIKEGYAMFENPESSRKSRWKNYFLKSIEQTL